MRWSIKTIFDNISKTSLLLTILLGLLTAIFLMLNASVQKTDLLLHQKALMKEAYDLGREDIQLSNIQLKGIINNIKHDITKMRDTFEYDILGAYLLGHRDDYMHDLQQLNDKQLLYIEAVYAYYDQSLENLQARMKDYAVAQTSYEAAISQLQEKHLAYEAEKFNLYQYVVYVAFLTSLLSTLWFSRRLSFIYNDLRTLFSVDEKGNERMFFTEEAEMITKRLSRKPTATENPAFIDPVTELNNYKGLLHGFANRKGNNGASLTVCLFAIDNFKELEKKYQKDLTNQILKKIASMLSLYEQHTDVLGRIDYDQFVLILNRASKDIALHECEQLRKSIEEAKFKAPKGESIRVTVSGGFVVKTQNKQLDQTILQAKEVLVSALKQGGNRIAQLRDSSDRKLRV